jgi:hypothetical protein
MIVSVSAHVLLLLLTDESGSNFVKSSHPVFARIVDGRVVSVDGLAEVLGERSSPESQKIVDSKVKSGHQFAQADRGDSDHIEVPKLLAPPDFSGEDLQKLASGGRFTFRIVVNQLGVIDSVTLDISESDSPFNQLLVDELIRRISAAQFLAGRKGGSPVRTEFTFTVELKQE